MALGILKDCKVSCADGYLVEGQLGVCKLGKTFSGSGQTRHAEIMYQAPLVPLSLDSLAGDFAILTGVVSHPFLLTGL